ncbi:hypothetical protein EXIGLDRAFT_84419 [Exidia glandulosa HHB12029]|uniref:Chromo shadow domain-containing protein n=1 Tax=Exidia glandulosa HHB12029 TaxID=1314781 RepID=A0A165HI51_EXIGL|nr:hypothetical protein EXIGLDRAFT_84419 [Exidia glandulosa HHB12029]
MVEEYWLKYKGKDKPEAKKRVSTGGKPTPKSSSKKTKVESDDDEPPEEPKKRRVSNAGAAAEDEDRPKKKQKMVTTMSTEMKKMSSSGLDADQLKAKLAAVADTSITEVPDPDLGTMQPFMHLRTWENMVQSIQTVEAADDKTLRVYFVIKDKETGDERRVVEDSAVCGKKFPQKLIQFYESHLRWRPAEDSA